MEHASRLDLQSYEDPAFYDILERARVQATDRIAMIQAIGAIMQQLVIAASLSLSVLWFSPLLVEHPSNAGTATAGLPEGAGRE
jgi:ATP-binding cassette subfamily B protein